MQAAVDDLWQLDGVTPQYVDVLSEAERAAVKRIEEGGYERVGVGTDRVVFALGGGTVVKLARPPHGSYDGYRANKKEAQRWRNATVKQEAILAPVHDVGESGKWLTMERATEIRGYEHEMREDFMQRCEDCNVNMNADALGWNVGFVPSQGHDCFIDYAHDVF